MKAPCEENANAIWVCILEGEEVQEILACSQPDPVCLLSQAEGLVFTSYFSNKNNILMACKMHTRTSNQNFCHANRSLTFTCQLECTRIFPWPCATLGISQAKYFILGCLHYRLKACSSNCQLLPPFMHFSPAVGAPWLLAKLMSTKNKD